ncbi:MAG: hypothetical protein KatS3mg015_2784 [Fimbriimonadales bacterium]|nr:MAG: hypothetical protein KatS3mg015_2784 [Fimbriimonadales bacterium]
MAQTQATATQTMNPMMQLITHLLASGGASIPNPFQGVAQGVQQQLAVQALRDLLAGAQQASTAPTAAAPQTPPPDAVRPDGSPTTSPLNYIQRKTTVTGEVPQGSSLLNIMLKDAADPQTQGRLTISGDKVSYSSRLGDILSSFVPSSLQAPSMTTEKPSEPPPAPSLLRFLKEVGGTETGGTPPFAEALRRIPAAALAGLTTSDLLKAAELYETGRLGEIQSQDRRLAQAVEAWKAIAKDETPERLRQLLMVLSVKDPLMRQFLLKALYPSATEQPGAIEEYLAVQAMTPEERERYYRHRYKVAPPPEVKLVNLAQTPEELKQLTSIAGMRAQAAAQGGVTGRAQAYSDPETYIKSGAFDNDVRSKILELPTHVTDLLIEAMMDPVITEQAQRDSSFQRLLNDGQAYRKYREAVVARDQLMSMFPDRRFRLGFERDPETGRLTSVVVGDESKIYFKRGL